MSRAGIEAIVEQFAGRTAEDRVRLAGEVAAQLERFVDAVTEQDVEALPAELAFARGAMVALRAVAGH